MRLLLTMTLVLAVAGCGDQPSRATLAQQQLVQVRQIQESYDRELKDPTFAVIDGKVNLQEAYRPSENPCVMADRDRPPTAEEGIALKRWADLHQRQLTKLEAVLLTAPEGSSALKESVDRFYAVMDNGLRSQLVLISSLAEGRISYCQFAVEDKNLTNGVLREAAALRSDVGREIQQESSLAHNWTFPSNSGTNNVKLK